MFNQFQEMQLPREELDFGEELFSLHFGLRG